jgi:uncharacterized protein YigE (DUF2233 family)
MENQVLKILATEATLIQSCRYEDKVQYKEGKSHAKGHRMRTQYKMFHKQRKGKPYTVLKDLSSEMTEVRSE